MAASPSSSARWGFIYFHPTHTAASLSFDTIFIQDNNETTIDLRASIIHGLQRDPPELPSVIMWDAAGLSHYEALCHHPAYYLRRAEVEILSQHAACVAQTIPAHAVIIELGCGSLTKTGLLLSALAAQGKPIAYYALDLVASTLAASLRSLCTAFPAEGPVQVAGLLGSYEDCLGWIPELCGIRGTGGDIVGDGPAAATPPSIHFLWMGNTIANMELVKAASLLASFRQACAAVPCAFVVGVDGCRDEERLAAAYDMSQGPFYAFMRNGLVTANRLLGAEVFEPDLWLVQGSFDAKTKMMRFGHQTDESVTGTWIQQLVSGKWTANDVQEVADLAGFVLSKIWADEAGSYGKSSQ
ncbi:uncharacterized protein BP01DRAFT_371431 [Aspergillus saccharolyticus JOP 1030-1]|uniref:Histidine-specific methyltransferase SAM-dependent domain-containing protein n=1 Tax=Aspergillus saccharolyticus JOP 1030-1 TaxID=1450539 RepID=A0A319APZ1_9EURO|nr:hypothetical protein BP01DRAFT_371431 [Aspergillus saccharolyticus JOP 1030-1]PYH48472.1 hypothetical protein BP01DRAFT_371431 [Aspergillus saccharolyticus JOP 1030-1]